jgi:hypothetical protein
LFAASISRSTLDTRIRYSVSSKRIAPAVLFQFPRETAVPRSFRRDRSRVIFGAIESEHRKRKELDAKNAALDANRTATEHEEDARATGHRIGET